MANQQSKRDDNRVPALVIHDSTGAETRQVRATSANPNALPVELVASGSGASSNQVQGTAADNAAAVGNPLLGGAKYLTSAPTYDNADATTLQADVNGNLKGREQYAPTAEDNTAGVIKTEHRYTATKVTADTQIKSGEGFLHTLTFSPNDAAPTAGSIIVYDSLTETGTELFNVTFTTTWFAPFTVIIDGTFSTGLYVGFTTTNDVNCTVSYR